MAFDYSWMVGPNAKLARAVEHLETLERECDRFLKTKPYSVAAEFQPQTRDYLVRFRVRNWMAPAAGVVVGELIHDLRSALEHLVWLIAASRIDQIEGVTDLEALWETRSEVTFPVAKTPEDFAAAPVRKFIGDDAMAVLSQFQPYTGRNETEVAGHPLLHLHDLWNIDKHRVLHAAAGQVDLSGVSYRPGALSGEELAKGVDKTPLPFESLKDGTALERIRFRGLHQPGTTEIYIRGEPAVEILFSAGERATSVKGLGGLCSFVADVLNTAMPLFPAAS